MSETYNKMKEKGLIDHLDIVAKEHEDEPDGAFFQILKDAVADFNQEEGTNFDESDALFAWIRGANK